MQCKPAIAAYCGDASGVTLVHRVQVLRNQLKFGSEWQQDKSLVVTRHLQRSSGSDKNMMTEHVGWHVVRLHTKHQGRKK